MRKARYQEARRERNRLINLRNKRETDLLVELGNAREEDPELNEEEWLDTFNQTYPKVEIPEQMEKDTDMDYDGPGEPKEELGEGEEEQDLTGGLEEQADIESVES